MNLHGRDHLESEPSQLLSWVSLLRALSGCVSHTSKEGNYKTSLGNLFQCLITLILNVFPYIWLELSSLQFVLHSLCCLTRQKSPPTYQVTSLESWELWEFSLPISACEKFLKLGKILRSWYWVRFQDSPVCCSISSTGIVFLSVGRSLREEKLQQKGHMKEKSLICCSFCQCQ